MFGEDDHDEVWRRQIAICHRLDVTVNELTDKLDLLAVPHLDLTVATSTEAGAVTTTPMLDAIRRRIERTKPGLIGLNNSAKLFAVPEGNRIAVTRCVGLLIREQGRDAPQHRRRAWWYRWSSGRGRQRRRAAPA